MKFLVKAEVERMNEAAVGSYNLLTIPIEIKDMGLSIELTLCKKSIKSALNTRNNNLITACKEYVGKNDMAVNGMVVNEFALSTIVSDLSMGAFGTGDEVFLVDVKTPKQKLSELKKEYKEELKQIKDITNKVGKHQPIKINHDISNKELLSEVRNAISGIQVIQTNQPISVNKPNTTPTITQQVPQKSSDGFISNHAPGTENYRIEKETRDAAKKTKNKKLGKRSTLPF